MNSFLPKGTYRPYTANTKDKQKNNEPTKNASDAQDNVTDWCNQSKGSEELTHLSALSISCAS